MAGADGAALQQQLSAAGAAMKAAAESFGGLIATGGLSDAQVDALTTSVTQAMRAQLTELLQPIQTQLDAQADQLRRVSDDVLATRVLACKSYNATCGEGGARPYTPVPNAYGEFQPHGATALRDRDALMELDAERAARWCKHYGVDPPPEGLAERKRLVAAELGAVVLLD